MRHLRLSVLLLALPFLATSCKEWTLNEPAPGAKASMPLAGMGTTKPAVKEISTAAKPTQSASQMEMKGTALAFVFNASPRAKPALVAELMRADKPLKRYGIDSNPERLLHFLSQVATETGGFRVLEENTNYSAEQLLKVFPKRVTPAQATALHRQPRAVANFVYNGRMKNRAGSDDGWNFRGSGYLQLTGRDNFTNIGTRLGKPFADEPDRVRQASDGLDAALEYWAWRGVNAVADGNSVRAVRHKVNGGEIGLDVAIIWHEQMKKAYRQQNPGVVLEAGGAGEPTAEEAAARILAELGHLDGLELENTGIDSEGLSDALKTFQTSRKLKPTGVLDTDTLYEITDPYGRFKTVKEL